MAQLGGLPACNRAPAGPEPFEIDGPRSLDGGHGPLGMAGAGRGWAAARGTGGPLLAARSAQLLAPPLTALPRGLMV